MNSENQLYFSTLGQTIVLMTAPFNYYADVPHFVINVRDTVMKVKNVDTFFMFTGNIDNNLLPHHMAVYRTETTLQVSAILLSCRGTETHNGQFVPRLPPPTFPNCFCFWGWKMLEDTSVE